MLFSRITNTLAGLWDRSCRPFFRGRATRKTVGYKAEPGISHLPDSQSRFLKTLDALPEKTRQIYFAHSRDDLAYREIALQMGTTIGEVEQEIAYALSYLADALDEA